jgi:hypothetical protein
MSYNSGVEVLLNDGLNNQLKKAQFYNIEDAGAETLDVAVNSISFSNVGAAPIELNGYQIPVGASISFDAGGGDNRFPSGTFSWDTSSGGAGILLIAYTW